jgi:hypothetical protein
VLGDGICECLWLGDNDVTLSMVKQAYQNFNSNYPRKENKKWLGRKLKGLNVLATKKQRDKGGKKTVQRGSA